MKKILAYCLGILVLTVITTSCEKSCMCKSYVGGSEIGDVEYANPDEVNCSTFTTYNEAMQTGVKCE